MKHIMGLIHRTPKDRQDVCSTHGPYTAKCYFGDVWTTCPDCASEVKAKENAAFEEKLKNEKRLKWIGKLGAACIPTKFQDRSLKTFVATTEPQKKALQFATEYADGFEENLKLGRCAVFLGQPGTGKTHLAVGIALRLMHRQNRIVHFTTVHKAVSRVKATWNKSSEETELDAINSMTVPDLLILDEVGVQFGSEAEKLILFQIINERYENLRPTLLLSNLRINEIAEYLGERIVDRLRENGGKYIVFDWESYRGKENVHNT